MRDVSIQIVPLRNRRGQRQLSDELLRDLWRVIVREGKVETTFYAGGVVTPEDFHEFLADASRLVSLAVEQPSGRLRAAAWLTNITDGSAFAHYVTLGGFRRDVGRAVLEQWAGLTDVEGRPLVQRLLGVTPEANRPAVRLLQLLGFTVLGAIPDYCRTPYLGGRCGGVISYRTLSPSQEKGT